MGPVLRLGYKKTKEGYEGIFAYRQSRYSKDLWKVKTGISRLCINDAFRDAAILRKDYMTQNGLENHHSFSVSDQAHLDIIWL